MVEFLWDGLTGGQETRDALALADSYRLGLVDSSTQTRMMCGHAIGAAGCIPRLAWEVLAQGIKEVTYTLLWPLVGVAAVAVVAEVIGLPFVATLVVGAALSLYSSLVGLVVSTLCLSAPIFFTGGLGLLIAGGVVHQLVSGGSLPAAKEFHRHLNWLTDPCRAAQADYEACKQHQWDRFVTGSAIGVVVVALAIIAAYRPPHLTMFPRIQFPSFSFRH